MANIFSGNGEANINQMTIHDVISRIEKLNNGIAEFWKHSNGWAQTTAATLLGKSRLDWQASLSSSLRLWVGDSNKTLTPAELILGWVNLGCLAEGTLKTFLSVFYEDFKSDIATLKKLGIYDHKKQQIKEPDGLTLEPLRQYFTEKNLLDDDGKNLLELIQKRRNAVHAFQDKSIGNDQELQSSIRQYLILLRYLHSHFPYPEPEELYCPREV